MKILFLFTLCALLPQFAFTQSTGHPAGKIIKSEIIDGDAYSTGLLGLYTNDKAETYLFKSIYKTKKTETPAYFIETYDAGLKMKDRKQVEVPAWNGLPLDFFSFEIAQGKTYVIWNTYDKKAHNNFLISSLLTADGKITQLIKISEHPGDDDFSNKKWGLYQSKDKHNWIVEKMVQNEKTKAKTYNYEMLDDQFRSVWAQDLKLDFKADITYVQTVQCNDKGQLFVLLNTVSDAKKNDVSTLKQVIWVNKTATSGPKIFPVEAKNTQILISGQFVFTENKMELYGTYAGLEGNEKYFTGAGTNPAGSYYANININDFKTESISFSPFSDKLYDYFRVKQKDRKDGMPGLHFSEMIYDATGKPVMVLKRWISNYYESGNRYHSSNETASALLLPYSEGKSGNIIYVPRGVHSDDTWEGHGLIVAKTENALHVLFNDSPKNRGKKIETDQDAVTGESPASTMKGQKKELDTVCFSLYADGKTASQKLFNSDDDGVFMNHTDLQQSGPNSFIFITGKDEKYQLVNMIFAP